MSTKGIKNKQAFQSVYIAFDLNKLIVVNVIQITINILTSYGNFGNPFVPLPQLAIYYLPIPRSNHEIFRDLF